MSNTIVKQLSQLFYILARLKEEKEMHNPLDKAGELQLALDERVSLIETCLNSGCFRPLPPSAR
ncbi:MAG: hypothetical protein OES79_10705 [Planctomycetota bacterium]|nr:hypothetical protein [Planctomycetota bacterium]